MAELGVVAFAEAFADIDGFAVKIATRGSRDWWRTPSRERRVIPAQGHAYGKMVSKHP